MWNKVKASLMEMMSDVKMAEGRGDWEAAAFQETAALAENANSDHPNDVFISLMSVLETVNYP